MYFLESIYPSLLSKYIKRYFKSKKIYINEPLSALSSFSCIFIYLYFLVYLNISDFSLLFIMYTMMSNQLGSFMMHSTHDNMMSCSDTYTMHIGFMARLFNLIISINITPIYIIFLLFSIVLPNVIFISVDAGLVSTISSIFLLQLFFTPELYFDLRLTCFFTFIALLFQVLSRQKTNIFPKMNKYIEYHIWWHYIINFTIIYYVYKFDVPLDKISKFNYFKYIFDIIFYGLISLISITVAFYKYYTNAKKLLCCHECNYKIL